MTLGKIPFLLIRLGTRINRKHKLVPKFRSTVHSKTSHTTTYEALIAANEN